MRDFQDSTGRNASVFPLSRFAIFHVRKNVAVERDPGTNHLVSRFRIARRSRPYCPCGATTAKGHALSRGERPLRTSRSAAAFSAASSTSAGGKVGRDALEIHVSAALDCVTNGGETFQAHAQPTHARIDLQMNRLDRRSEPLCCVVQQLDMPGLPDRGRELAANDLFFLATPETRHQEDASSQPRNSQGYAFIRCGHTEPLGPFCFKRQGARSRAVSIGVCLDHGTRDNVRADVLLYQAKVLAQRRKRNLRPGGTRGLAGFYVEGR